MFCSTSRFFFSAWPMFSTFLMLLRKLILALSPLLSLYLTPSPPLLSLSSLTSPAPYLSPWLCHFRRHYH